MSSTRSLQIIDRLDPHMIYVEHVRQVLNTSAKRARIYCEMAVREKLFIRKIGLICENTNCARVIAEFNTLEEIPTTIICDTCESNDEETYEFETANLKKIIFYRLP